MNNTGSLGTPKAVFAYDINERTIKHIASCTAKNIRVAEYKGWCILSAGTTGVYGVDSSTLSATKYFSPSYECPILDFGDGMYILSEYSGPYSYAINAATRTYLGQCGGYMYRAEFGIKLSTGIYLIHSSWGLWAYNPETKSTTSLHSVYSDNSNSNYSCYGLHEMPNGKILFLGYLKINDVLTRGIFFLELNPKSFNLIGPSSEFGITSNEVIKSLGNGEVLMGNAGSKGVIKVTPDGKCSYIIDLIKDWTTFEENEDVVVISSSSRKEKVSATYNKNTGVVTKN